MISVAMSYRVSKIHLEGRRIKRTRLITKTEGLKMMGVCKGKHTLYFYDL